VNYLDLFSGIGGFSLGFQRAGWKFDKHYFSEINKYAIKVYQRHFPDAIGLGSITGIRPEELGQIDLITFGFPCQDLSIAGKRAGLEGSRSGLFFEAMRIIRYLKPSIFVFENVEGLLTSNDGKDFEIVLREIADIGLYECEWQLLNTSWVLPQNRERVYFIGHLGERGGRKVFPIGEGDFKTNISNGEAQCSIIDPNYLERDCRIYDDCCPTLSARDYKEGKMVVDRRIHQINNPKHSNDTLNSQHKVLVKPCLTPNRPEKRQNGRRFKEDGEDSFTLTSQDVHGVMICQS
jgi:DNA (cytosine-5)-methyltransferase 1